MGETVNLKVAADLGAIIASRRRELGLKQMDLASSLGMTSAQLCKIEKGRNLPDDATLLRLEHCLDWTPRGLVEAKGRILAAYTGEGVHRLAGITAALPRKGASRFVEFYRTRDRISGRCLGAEAFRPVTDFLASTVDSLANLEADAGSVHGEFPAAPLVPISLDEEDAEALAADVRTALGLGDAPVTDYVPALELAGCRVVFTDRLPHDVDVKGYFDRQDRAFVFAVNTCATTERQTYELVSELALACIFAQGGYETFGYTKKIGVFVRSFETAFLMPRAALTQVVCRLGVGPDDWTMKLVLSVKRLFGVSSLALLWCLWSRGQVSSERFADLRSAAEEYARRHPLAPEQRPLPPLQQDWLRRQLTDRLACGKPPAAC